MTDPAPLVDIPEAPAPRRGEAEWFRGAGGVRLRAALFRPPGRPRGSIVVSGGRTEPIEKYYEFVGDLQDRGFVVLLHDWRGQGLSARELGDRLKSHANGFKPFLDDFQALLQAFEERMPKPWVAFGHSMGGTLTLLALALGERRFAGAILSAPMLGVRTAPTSQGAARWATRTNIMFGRRGRYVKRRGVRPPDGRFEGNVLTHDPARFARHRAQLDAEPDLALGQPTWGWLDFAFKACAVLARPERLRAITVPVTIVSAEDEQLVDNAAQAAAARHLPQGRLIVVPGAYHEILMETDPMRNIFMKALDALLGRAAPEPAKPPQPAAAPAPKPTPVAAAPTPAPTPAPAPAFAPAPVAAAPKPPAARKPAAKAPAAPKAAAKKPAAGKAKAKPAAAKPSPAAAKKTATRKPAARKAAPVKPAAAAKPAAPKAAAARKPAAKKASAVKKAAAPKKPAAAKPAAVKKAPAAKKPAARKPAARKPAPAKA